MKQRLLIIFLSLFLVQAGAFAQQQFKGNLKGSLPLLADEGITSIVASDNIDLVLIQDDAANVKVKASDYDIRRLKVSLADSRLFLDASKPLNPEERLIVYVWVNDLENLTLKGNSFAVSQGILQGRNLHVSIGSDATVSLKSKGKVWFDAPSSHKISKQDGYFVVSAID